LNTSRKELVLAQTLSYEEQVRAGLHAGVHAGVSLGVRFVLDMAFSQHQTNTAADSININQRTHKLAPIAGMFADDPMWAEYLEVIKEIQQEETLD